MASYATPQEVPCIQGDPHSTFNNIVQTLRTVKTIPQALEAKVHSQSEAPKHGSADGASRPTYSVATIRKLPCN